MINGVSHMSKSKLITLTIFTYVLLLPVFLSAETFKLPDTGQTKCYQGVSPWAEIPCTETGQDGAYNINPLSYTDNQNGTVTDNNTGLIWQEQDDGTQRTWDEAVSYCSSFGTDWRLPSGRELLSIVDYSRYSPAINTTYFPNTQPNWYWSSTESAQYPEAAAWWLNFDRGNLYIYYPNKQWNKAYARCVKGQQFPLSFHDNGDGTVLDNNTGLMWQKQSASRPCFPYYENCWQTALDYCSGLSIGTISGWRLPNIKELASIFDASRYAPASDTNVFSEPYGGTGTVFWSSTTDAQDNYWAWLLLSYYGEVGSWTTANKGNGPFDVRCVRGGQVEPPPAYGNLEVSPSSHDFGEVAVELCSAPQQFTLSNTGNGDLTISEIALSDNENFELSINALQCEKAIQPGDSCAFDVYFCPKTSGDLSANLTITSDDPDTPSYSVSLRGTGLSTTKGWVVTIDGTHIISFLLEDYYPPPTQYLKNAIDLDWTNSIQNTVGTIWSFSWSNNINDTGEAISKLTQRLKDLTALNKKTNAPLVILSHSWGTVLAYISISKNSDIFVDKFITLGSPLNATDPLIKQITKEYLDAFSISLTRPSNVKEWHNYWALCDTISGKISAADTNDKDKKIYLGLTPFETTLEKCHASYFTKEKIWTKILKDILKK